MHERDSKRKISISWKRPCMPIKGSNTRVRSHSSLRLLFIVTIRLRWRWIMMTGVITWLPGASLKLG